MRANRRAAAYLSAAFAISWTALAVAWIEGARTLADAPQANAAFVLGPPLAALGCVLCFDKGERLRALGLAIKPNRWWLVAVVLPIVFAAYLLGAARLLPELRLPHLVDPHAAATMLLHIPAARLPAGAAGSVAIMATAAIGFTVLFTVTEEMGWRGYLYCQWRRLGFWRYSLISGLIWGVWHWPMVILFGLIFSADRVLGLVYYPLALISLAPFMTLLRDRAGSVWAPGIFHGVFNAITILAFGGLSHGNSPGFAEVLLTFPLLGFLELFQRKWALRRGRSTPDQVGVANELPPTAIRRAE